jgi:2-methylcitrate dehydratase PrpD
VLQAKMSIPFCVAVALVDGGISEASFVERSREELKRVVAVTRLVVDPIFTGAYPAQQGAEVIVTLRDGMSHSVQMNDLEVASADRVASRFTAAAREVVGASRAEQIARGVADIENLEDVETLIRLTETAEL